MRKELKLIEEIENYLMNKLNENDRILFEKRINTDETLKNQIKIQKLVIEGIQRMGLKNATKSAHYKYKKINLFKKIALTIIIISAIVTTGYFLVNNEDDLEMAPQINPIKKTALIDFPKDDSLSGTANKYLSQEIFKLKTNQDTLIESNDGLLVFIPANAFDTKANYVDFLIQTALNTEDVLKAGLSTTSNGAPLETGGMFYLDAFDEKGRVALLKQLDVHVPTSEKKGEMQLFDGEVMENGEVNWINPTAINNDLKTVDILSLDFYPPEYESKLDELELYGKAFRDSLYYSFSYNNLDYTSIPIVSTEDVDDLKPRFYPNSKIGQKLFETNCASCHFPRKDMTGPALNGAKERWIENSSEENFYQFIKNSQAVINTGDNYATNLFNMWNKSVMTNQNVTNDQIDHIFAYIDSLTFETGQADTAVLLRGVNPASIQTIWSTHFNHTLLATKEFEQRIPWIHRSGNDEVLQVYIKNSDTTMQYCDLLAAQMTFGEIRNKFLAFANLNEGGVKEDKGSKALFDYFKQKKKKVIQQIRNEQENYWMNQTEKDNQRQKRIDNSTFRNNKNQNEILSKEINFNLKKSYEKLDMNQSIKMPLTYSVSINTLGWKNIDREIVELTIGRNTKSIAVNDKTVTIDYQDWSVKIENETNYDRTYVYNIPKLFSSYIKIPSKKGMYNYKLNESIDYQTLILAWDKDQIYFHQDKTTKKGNYLIKLKPIAIDEFRNNISNSLNQISTMKEEMSFIEKQQKDQNRVAKNKNLIKLREKIEPFVFPSAN